MDFLELAANLSDRQSKWQYKHQIVSNTNIKQLVIKEKGEPVAHMAKRSVNHLQPPSQIENSHKKGDLGKKEKISEMKNEKSRQAERLRQKREYKIKLIEISNWE